MTAADFIQDLHEQGIHLRLVGDQIECIAGPDQLTPELRNQLRDRRDGLLAELSRQSDAAPPTKPHLTSPAERPVPVSPTQYGLWHIDQMEGGHSTTYTTRRVYSISGRIDLDAFRRSLDAIYHRHSTLRTRFEVENDIPVQVIAPSGPFPFRIVDLRSVPDKDRHLVVARHRDQTLKQPFDLGNGPCARAVIIRHSDDECVFILMIHHIITDGWSASIFSKELSTHYNSLVRGEASPLAALPLQYADFAREQHVLRDTPAYHRSLQYWKVNLKDAPASVNLPLDRPRPPRQTYNGRSFRFTVSLSLLSRLKAVCRANRVTLFMALVAGLNLVLRRFGDQDDILLGTPIANRSKSAYEHLIGFFATTVVLRSDLSGVKTYHDVLSRSRTVVLGAQEHQIVPFEQIVATLRLKRDPAVSPLFQVMIVLQNTPEESMSLIGCTVERLAVAGTAALFDLLFSINETSQGLEVNLRYNSDLFDEATIRDIAKSFQSIVESMVDDVHAEIDKDVHAALD